MTRTFHLDGGGTVAADPGGNVYVAWHGGTPRTVSPATYAAAPLASLKTSERLTT